MYRIKYFNIQTEERVDFDVTDHRDLSSQLENYGIDQLDPFWKKLGTSDEIPIEE